MSATTAIGTPTSGARPPAARTLRSELRALLAVARKEWTISRRYPTWIVAFAIWPVLFPIGYIFAAKALGGPDGAGLATFAAQTGTTDYPAYIIIGTMLYMWLNITLWDVGFHLRNEQMRGTLESTWLCPVWRSSILVGGGLAKLVPALAFLLITVVEFWALFDIRLVRGNPWLLLLIFLLLIPTIYGIGMVFGSLVIRFKEANALVFLVRGIFMIFCGTAYPVAVLPDWMQRAAAVLPLTYAIRDIRAVALTGATLADIGADLLTLAGFAAILPVLGGVAFSFTERQARRTGTLGQY